jgi:hypothetical protein
MKYYMVAEMVPHEQVETSPSHEFAPGTGFESPNCDFWVYGPADDWTEFEVQHDRLMSEGYECYFQSVGSPIM